MNERGSATLETLLAVGFLLIPVAALLAQVPGWIAVEQAAQVAANEAARQVVLADSMASGAAAARLTVDEVIANHGLAAEPAPRCHRRRIPTRRALQRTSGDRRRLGARQSHRGAGHWRDGQPVHRHRIGQRTGRRLPRVRTMNDERGSITIWALGLSMLLFAVGFLSLDLWSGFTARSQAAAIADSAAIAGATALDTDAWRSGQVALDPAAAGARAVAAAVGHPAWNDTMTVTASADTVGVTVAVTRTIPFRFVAGFVPDQAIDITVTGYAQPGESP